MKPILEVHQVSKQYKIGAKQEAYLSLREKMSTFFKKSPSTERFWALQDIDFQVQEGECIGIIGKNGAGKSTLLKILAKITPPTKGHVKYHGRIASLLEVGTGFHPELSGRENIYLNGSILGLRRVEINAKLEEIIEFSGVEKFLDTPLKRYSSGMKLRLAFAVAAHLEPEILLIDEVLAVGDTEFQKKCMGKMDEVSKSGRTILFVSHNLGAVKNLCKQSILLNKGKIIARGATADCIDTYLNTNVTSTNERIDFDGPMASYFDLIEPKINGKYLGHERLCFSPDESIKIELPFSSLFQQPFRITLSLFKNGVRLFSINDQLAKSGSSRFTAVFELPSYFLRPGIYAIAIGGNNGNLLDKWFWKEDVFSFEILEVWDEKMEAIDWGIIKVKAAKTYRIL
ncbi:MAG: ABC transporter ATP-binding protein [Bacteroidota bacterium]